MLDWMDFGMPDCETTLKVAGVYPVQIEEEEG